MVKEGVTGVYMKNLGYLPINFVVNLEFIMVQIYLNANDYSLKFHVLELPKLPYTAVGLLSLNLTSYS